jgi:predicted nucleotidyltransferase
MKRKLDQAAQTSSIKKSIKNYIEELRNHGIPVNEIILFGSCVRGGAKEESDIDVAIVSEAFSGDRFEDRRRIVPLRRGIDSRIEPIPLTPAAFAAGGNLIDEIKRTGIRIAA